MSGIDGATLFTPPKLPSILGPLLHLTEFQELILT